MPATVFGSLLLVLNVAFAFLGVASAVYFGADVQITAVILFSAAANLTSQVLFSDSLLLLEQHSGLPLEAKQIEFAAAQRKCLKRAVIALPIGCMAFTLGAYALGASFWCGILWVPYCLAFAMSPLFQLAMTTDFRRTMIAQCFGVTAKGVVFSSLFFAAPIYALAMGIGLIAQQVVTALFALRLTRLRLPSKEMPLPGGGLDLRALAIANREPLLTLLESSLIKLAFPTLSASYGVLSPFLSLLRQTTNFFVDQDRALGTRISWRRIALVIGALMFVIVGVAAAVLAKPAEMMGANPITALLVRIDPVWLLGMAIYAVGYAAYAYCVLQDGRNRKRLVGVVLSLVGFVIALLGLQALTQTSFLAVLATTGAALTIAAAASRITSMSWLVSRGDRRA
jgi:hypothetical protein